jgi:hypothetical protein
LRLKVVFSESAQQGKPAAPNFVLRLRTSAKVFQMKGDRNIRKFQSVSLEASSSLLPIAILKGLPAKEIGSQHAG